MATSAAVNLEEVQSVDLMTELLRRMKCSTKPDKRLILVGINIFLLLFILSYFSLDPMLGFHFSIKLDVTETLNCNILKLDIISNVFMLSNLFI